MDNLALDVTIEPVKEYQWDEDVSKVLKDGDKCVLTCVGSSVVDWLKSPVIVAIVACPGQGNALFCYSHPGIGCNDINLKLHTVIPLDSQTTIKSDSANVPMTADKGELINLIYKGKDNRLEIDNSEKTPLVLDIINASCKRETGTDSNHDNTQWIRRYSVCLTSNDDWPWGHVIQPDPAEETPIAFHADDDILSFDPYAPSSTKVNDAAAPRPDGTTPVGLPRQGTIDVSEFDDINEAPPIDTSTDDYFGRPAPRSSFLRRSRDVMSLRKSTNTLGPVQPDPSIETNGIEPPSVPMSYDVVDNDVIGDVKTAEPVPMIPGKASSSFRGSKARENLVRLRMAARESEFTELFPFTVFVGTWNVNGQTPSENVTPWLAADSIPPDIVAIGFQELDLSTEALVFNESSREEAWINILSKGLHPSAEYKRIRTIRLVGMMLVCFVQTKHLAHVFDVEAETVATGIMGMMGNKGGVAIRFQIHNSTICFVNSHLAAHLQEYQRRNQDFREITSKLSFQQIQPPVSILHHDVVIWIGDLNYRFDELDVETVKTHIQNRTYSNLFHFDQLNRQMKAKKVFQGYTESPIDFQPTYKYDPGTDNWDSSEKARAPAWCDRVLWRGKHMKQVEYRSHPELRLSDHKPVSGLFEVGIKIVNRDRQKLVSEQIIWKLDREENESLPQVKLGLYEFHFNDVHFMEDRSDYLPVANVGQVPVEYKFIPKNDESVICHPWIRVNPAAGFIMPGDAIEIELSINIDKMSVPLLAKLKGRIDDILVLHLVNGKDFFVPINGNHVPSVFGTPLDALVRMYGPISESTSDSLSTTGMKHVASNVDSASEEAEPLEIPKELWLIIDHLHKHGMKEDGILLQTGVDEDIINIRTYLDTCHGGPLPGSIYSVGEALLLFLEALPEPVIPFAYHNKCLEACNNYVLCKQVVSQLPTTHLNVFVYLMAFLRELLIYSPENRLDVKMLAAVFGSILLRPKTQISLPNSQNKRALAQAAQKKARFVAHFLVNDFKI